MSGPDGGWESRRRTPARSLYEFTELRTILGHIDRELTRPLESLRAGVELALCDNSQRLPEEARSHLAPLTSVFDELMGLTGRYLAYIELVQSQRPLTLAAYTVAAIVREVELTHRAEAETRSIGFSARLEGPDLTVMTDATRCQQLFGHLIANALSYTPKGGRVDVVAAIEESGWTVTITDNGPGIPFEEQRIMFEPISRPRQAETGYGSRSDGLGLALCRELAAQLGGELKLESSRETGTRIQVSFPLSNRTAEPSQG